MKATLILDAASPRLLVRLRKVAPTVVRVTARKADVPLSALAANHPEHIAPSRDTAAVFPPVRPDKRSAPARRTVLTRNAPVPPVRARSPVPTDARHTARKAVAPTSALAANHPEHIAPSRDTAAVFPPVRPDKRSAPARRTVLTRNAPVPPVRARSPVPTDARHTARKAVAPTSAPAVIPTTAATGQR